MNIGELFVTLGAQVDSSWTDGMKKLKGMGESAKQAAQVAKNAMGDFRQAVRNASFDAKSAADKVIDASKRQASAVEASAKRQAAAHALVARSSAEAARVVAGISKARPSGLQWGSVGDPFNPGAQRTMIRDAQANAALMARRGGPSAGGNAVNQMRADLRGYVSMEELLADRTGAHPAVGWAQFRANAPTPRGSGTVVDENAAFAAAARGGGPLKKFQAGSGGGMFGYGSGGPPKAPRKGGGGGGGGGRGGGGSPFSRFGPLGDASAFRRVILGAGIYQGVQQFGQLADVYLNLQNRLRGVTNSQAEANATFDRLKLIANNTRSGIESTAEGYVRLKNATEGMNLSSDDQFKLIERINMALATSGATASEARSGMMQLTQALAKGKLDGDEFRSLAENMPNILKILQKSLGVTEGRLRSMSRNGELTREKIVKALLGPNGLEEAFGKTNATFGQTYEIFKNKLIEAFGKLAEDKELVASFGKVMSALADVIIVLVGALGKLVDILGPFFSALKDGKPWAIALVAALGLLATAWWSVARAAAAAAAAQAAASGGPANIGVGGKILGGGSKFMKGLGVASGVSMYATSQGDSTAGTLGRIGGAAMTGGSLAGPWGALAGALIGTGIEAWNAPNLTPDQIAAASRVMQGGGGLFDAAKAAAQVNVGPTTVNIYAKDMKDAKEQFDKEMIDRTMRHAGAAVNRGGS